MCGEKWLAEACEQWRYESRVKMAGGRSTTPETDSLGADGSERPIYLGKRFLFHPKLGPTPITTCVK